MEMETSNIHDSKSIAQGDRRSGTPYDPGIQLNGNSGTYDTNPTSGETGLNDAQSEVQMLENEEFVIDPQESRQVSRGPNPPDQRLVNPSIDEVDVMSVSSQNFIDNSHGSGFSIDPNGGPQQRAFTYDKTGFGLGPEANGVVTSSAQGFYPQSTMAQGQQQHIQHISQSATMGNHPGQQSLAYVDQTRIPHQNYHIQQHQSVTDGDELFVPHLEATQELGSHVPQSMPAQSLATTTAGTPASAPVAPYAGMNMIASSTQLHYQGQFGDSMEVGMGMDFASMRHPMPMPSTPVGVIPPVRNETPSSSVGSGRKRKASEITDADPAELEQMTNSMGMSLADFAVRVREEENGSQGEKFRQTFAMAWLRKNCEMSSDAAVPRNRIYARYVAVCAEHKLKPLNPASFGKRVRVAYPGIKTRRLGIRGQSKYHYCGFRLVGDLNNSTGSTPTGTPGRFGNSPDRYVYKSVWDLLTCLA